jgi:hypothetical protein
MHNGGPAVTGCDGSVLRASASACAPQLRQGLVDRPRDLARDVAMWPNPAFDRTRRSAQRFLGKRKWRRARHLNVGHRTRTHDDATVDPSGNRGSFPKRDGEREPARPGEC